MPDEVEGFGFQLEAAKKAAFFNNKNESGGIKDEYR